MIIIKVYGVDPYMLNTLSKDLTSKLAELYEVKKDEISFLTFEGSFLHNEIDQTSYNAYIEVHLPNIFHDLEENAFKIITNYMKLVVINLECVFYYFEVHHHHDYINEEYPRFLENSKITEVHDEEEEETLSSFENDEMLSEDDLFLGNAFEGFEDKIKK